MRGQAIIDPTAADLDAYVDQVVTVAYCRELGKRNNFDTQLAINGTLQKHPEKEQYRVLVSKETFAYFWGDDVKMITNNEETGTRVFHLDY